MNGTFVRKIDELGRVVIPSEIRRDMDLREKDEITLSSDGKNLTIRRHTPACHFCALKEGLIKYEGRYICHKCVGEITKISS